MRQPRSKQIILNITPFYHCMSRCVRGAFLCGVNYKAGVDYSHRKGLIASRIYYLSTVFCMKICAYAVMSNHYHLILYVDEQMGNTMSPEEIVLRWSILFSQAAKSIQKLDLNNPIVKEKIECWRKRLLNISWFIRCLNEYIAKVCNKEDKCKGRFWEERFKVQDLLDDGALMAAMAYVDLNPVRSKMALTPESSQFTSIMDRINYAKKMIKSDLCLSDKTPDGLINKLNLASQPLGLMPFSNNNDEMQILNPAIPFRLSDYIQLVDATGRVIREDKSGKIDVSLLPIISRLNLTVEGWTEMTSGLESHFGSFIGNPHKWNDLASNLRMRSIRSGSDIETLSRFYFSED